MGYNVRLTDEEKEIIDKSAGDKSSVCLLYVGAKKMGKTTRMRAAIKYMLKTRNIALIHDPYLQYVNPEEDSDRIFRSIDEFKKLPEWPNECIFSDDVSPQELAALAMEITQEGTAKNEDGTYKTVVLCCDEIERLCPKLVFPDDPEKKKGSIHHKPGNTHRIIHEGRHVRIDLVGSCRVPGEIHHSLKSQTGAVWIFWSHGEGTLRWVEKELGKKALYHAQTCEQFAFEIWTIEKARKWSVEEFTGDFKCVHCGKGQKEKRQLDLRGM